MKWISLIVILFSVLVDSQSDYTEEKPYSGEQLDREEFMKRPFNPDLYEYACKKTIDSALERLRFGLIPKELSNPDLKSKLSEERITELTRIFEKNYQREKEDMETILLKSLEAGKEEIGRYTKQEIDWNIAELVSGMGVVDEMLKKEEL